MREIKFRVWDKKFNKMHHQGVALDISDGRPIMVFDEWDGSEDDGDLEIMQFTGLKDINGQEIFEGDILNGKQSRYLVEWYEPNCCFLARSWQGDGVVFSKLEPVEVISNIWENPELLK